MSPCEKCKDIVDRQDVPHCIRTCESCGRVMYVHETGEHGIGFKIRKGDQVVIPGSWLKFAINPLKTTGQFSTGGLKWFAEMIFVDDLPAKKDEIKQELQKLEEGCETFLKISELLKDINLEGPDSGDRIFEVLKDKKDTAEWWSFLGAFYLSLVSDALSKNDIEQAIWAMACAERCRSMFVFKQHLEEVVIMGHSAKRIIDILRIWDNNKTNGDEEFWQIQLTGNSYVISQVFATPAVFIKDKAYVGGMNIDRKDAKFVDYLFSMESSREAILVEIKTPVTKLLGSKYRGIYCPSSELTGAIVQVLEYRTELINNLQGITKETQYNISAFNPKCVIIAGNGNSQLKGGVQRKSFELFRSTLKDVEIVTYDELFRKVEVLAKLFSLIRTKATN